ncbi:hypothetical protein CHS0354_030560 [Potamilus streckersoni]|uniref:Uncharacterized protein n=1 Tax=Potamilus streckersoni TaxID=2493646 RepID=A0AAE0S3I4_9BIVA|nr:hypothetical protein CHS0354_030560 [Potamilus streckersoni]
MNDENARKVSSHMQVMEFFIISWFRGCIYHRTCVLDQTMTSHFYNSNLQSFLREMWLKLAYACHACGVGTGAMLQRSV